MRIILTFPIARRPLSNSNKTPRNRKDIPKPTSPTPISEINILLLYIVLKFAFHFMLDRIIKKSYTFFINYKLFITYFVCLLFRTLFIICV